MKIIIIGSAHPLRGGGITTFNERLAEVLIQEGHEVVIVSYKVQYPKFLFPGKSQSTNESAPPNLTIKSWIHSMNPFNWIHVGNKIKKMNPDLVLTRYWLPFFGPCLGTIHRRIKKNKHTKIISILDNIIPHEKRMGDVPLTKYFLPANDGFLTMSKDVLKDLVKFNATQKVAYTPHPMYDNYGSEVSQESARETLGLSSEYQYLLFFGFIRKYKGLDLLLQAMADTRLQDKKVKLIVAGEYYGDKKYYEELITALKIQDRLELFTDFIPNDDVRIYFSACDVVVQPYRTATQSGISQIAYYFNKPMIVTNVGGLPEIVPDGKVGFVAEPDHQSIADHILKILNPGTLREMEENIKIERKKYEWTYFTQTIEKLMSEI